LLPRCASGRQRVWQVRDFASLEVLPWFGVLPYFSRQHCQPIWKQQQRIDFDQILENELWRCDWKIFCRL
jgi:hypothetical protein